MMLVSVLIPCHNSGRYIARCIKSVICQTYRQLQIVIVDDGSTDDSLDVIKSFAESDSRIKLVSQNFMGVADARNTALRCVRGAAVMFIDADDWIEPETIQILLNHLVEHKLDFCACSMVRETDRGDSLLLATEKDFEVCNRQQAKYNYLTQRALQGSVCNKLIRRECINGLHFQAGWNYAEDAMFVWNMLNRVNRCAQLSKILYHYSLTPNSLTEALYNDSHLTYITMWSSICQDISNTHPQWLNLAKGKMGNAITSTLYDIARSGVKRPKVVNSLCRKLRTCIRSMFECRAFSLRYVLFSICAINCWPLAVTAAKIWHRVRN